jgi:DNA polymerase-3 subunit gamma/tau
MISESRNAELVQAALRDLLGVDWRVRCVEAGDRDSAGGMGAASARSGSGAATQDSSRGSSPERPAPRARSSATAVRTTHDARRQAGGTADAPPADDEPDRVEPQGAGDRDDDYDPYSEIDPEADAASYEVHDPGKVAIELLTAKLGAHLIDDES